MLWLRSRHAEHWLLRRTNYTRSLAVMSMVGYILGLGDRHPSNLMLHRYTGKILHIDFGDCFEVAMRRDKFPETVRFRLTRMLVNAMEARAVPEHLGHISSPPSPTPQPLFTSSHLSPSISAPLPAAR